MKLGIFRNCEDGDMAGNIDDEFVFSLSQVLKEDDDRPHIISQKRTEQMEAAYKILERLAEDNNGVVSYKFNEPYKSMGYISIEANQISMTKDVFLYLRALSGNVDIYALTNGKVRLDLTFHGISTPIK